MAVKRWNAVWIGFLLFGLSQPMIQAQSGRSTASGVYTAGQAQQGKALYNKKCAMCHGATLRGSGANPPLSGDDFMNNWVGQTVGDLDVMIHTTMPATHPGSLTQAETTKLLAYILNVNQFPVGKTALPSSTAELRKIHIRKPRAKS